MGRRPGQLHTRLALKGLCPSVFRHDVYHRQEVYGSLGYTSTVFVLPLNLPPIDDPIPLLRRGAS